MPIPHAQLVEQILELVDRIFGDTSVSKDATRASLSEIVDEIETRLETL